MPISLGFCSLRGRRKKGRERGEEEKRESREKGNLRSGSIFVSLCNSIPAGKAF